MNALFCNRIQVWITYDTLCSSEQIFAICAFTTTTGFVSYVEIALNCEDTPKVKLGYAYPFR
jgi:hypothetical protein